jgi:hypothetical protein
VTSALSKWAVRRSSLQHMVARRAGVTALAFSLAGVTLMLLLVSVAARTGPSGVINGTPVDPSFNIARPTITTASTPPASGPDRTDRLPKGKPAYSWLPLLGLLIKLAVGAYLLVLIFRGLRKAIEAWQKRTRRAPRPVRIDFEVLDDPELVIEQIREDAVGQFELLLGGSPRNAIVACWDRFEEQAERVNASRRPWETASEFILRLLDAVKADDEAVQRLAALYQEARFSVHPVEEASRTAAIEALEAIHESLDIRRRARR